MSLASRLSDADAHPFILVDPLRVEFGPGKQWFAADRSECNIEFYRTRWPEISKSFHQKIVEDLGIVSCDYDAKSRSVIVKTETEMAIFSWEDGNGSWK